MKLYFAPDACSLADHIALLDVGEDFEAEAVDIRTRRLETGGDFRDVSSKGYVPALVFDDGRLLTENIAVLDWIADRHPILRPDGELGRTRLLEMLAFISTEIHRAYKPLWHGGSETELRKAREGVASLLRFAADQMQGDYLFGDAMSTADAYLFVMLRWADRFGIVVPEHLRRMQRLMEARPSVRTALAREAAAADRLRGRAAAAKVRENPGASRFERLITGEAMAAAYYRLEDGKVVFIHTETPTEFSGRGIATELARGAFDLLRATRRQAVLKCPFMVRFYSANPEYADIVAG